MIKNIILILGPNGVGKSTAAGELLKLLPRSAYIDSDSLLMVNMDFSAAIELQKANILAVMRNYLSSGEIDNIIFPYGLHGHRKLMLDTMLESLQSEFEFTVKTFVLDCSEYENIRRMELDGRGSDRIDRALKNTRSLYYDINYDKIYTTEMSPRQTAMAIFNLMNTDNTPF